MLNVLKRQGGFCIISLEIGKLHAKYLERRYGYGEHF